MFVVGVKGRFLFATILVFTGVASASSDSKYQSIDSRESERDAQRLTVEALRLETKVNESNEHQVRRKQLLELALKKSPDYAPAHWALGHIKQEGEWLPVAAVQEAAAKDPRIAEYEKRKQKVLNGQQGHEALAKWCKTQGLEDEARAHWIGLLQQEPDHRIALANLDLEWQEGQLIERSSTRSNTDDDREADRNKRKWAKLVARWARSRRAADPERDAVLDKVRSIDDEAAIPAFEQLATTLATNSPRRNRAYDLCEAFLESLDLMPGAAATESLVRFAVFTEEQSLRTQAAESLVGRPLEVSVPMLLSGLQPLTESKYDVAMDRRGNVAYQHKVLTKGREKNSELNRTRIGRQAVVEVVDPNLPSVESRNRSNLNNLNSIAEQRFWSQVMMLEYQKKAMELEEQISRSNLSAKVVNDRIFPVLRLSTAQQLDDNPQSWWDYWTDYRGYEINRDYEREYDYDEEVNTLYSSVAPVVRSAPLASSRNCECFIAGTPVITKLGSKAIETILPGDFVLSRDPSTRELSFRVVLEVTERQPSPMVKIQCGDETIISTVGHPFWIETLGWRMAKQLSEGDRLLALDKSIVVTGAEPAVDAVAYNLVVEGTATYLVGNQGVLVHDNTPAEARQRQLVMR